MRACVFACMCLCVSFYCSAIQSAEIVSTGMFNSMQVQWMKPFNSQHKETQCETERERERHTDGRTDARTYRRTVTEKLRGDKTETVVDCVRACLAADRADRPTGPLRRSVGRRQVRSTGEADGQAVKGLFIIHRHLELLCNLSIFYAPPMNATTDL